MPNLSAIEIKAFVPARDFELSRRFYAALGFEIPWTQGGLAYVRHGSTSFLLQDFFRREHAENFVMHLLVEDVDAWWAHASGLDLDSRFGAKAVPPEDRSWGIRDFTLIDPSGVLWRIGQNITTKN